MEENLIYQNNINNNNRDHVQKTTYRIWAPPAKKKRKEKVKCETYSQSNGRESMSNSWVTDRELN